MSENNVTRFPTFARHGTALLVASVAVMIAPLEANAQQAPPFAPSTSRGSPPPEAAPSAAPTAVTPPRLLHFVEAEYPAEARDAGLDGSVVLQLTIDDHGHVSEATVLTGLGHGLDEAAVAAARQFEFEPAHQGDHAIPTRIRYRYRFTLRVASSAPPQGPIAVLHGTILDGANHPLPLAEVTFDSATEATHVDADGHFRFDIDHAGTHALAVRVPGYREFRAAEELNAGDDLRVIYRMTPLPTASAAPASSAPEGEITVRGTRPQREVARETLDRREIQRIPGTGGDALRAIQNLPGLARPSFLSGALIVRGSSPADTQVFADGSGLPLLYHFGGLTSVIPTDMLDRIDFYPGNFSARYGRAMGGVVDVGLRSPRTSGYHGIANISVIDASIFVEGAITPTLSIALAARRSWIDAVLGVVLANSNSTFTASPVYYDYQAVIEWRPNPRNRVRFALFGDDDRLTVISNGSAGGMQVLAGGITLSTQFHIGQLSWVSDLAPGTRSTAMVSFGFAAQDLSTNTLGLKLENYPINARYELSHTVSRFLRLNFGFDVVSGPANTLINIPGGGNRPGLAVNASTFLIHPAAYIEGEFTPTEHLRLVPGVRFDWFNDINTGIVQPRLSGRYELPYGFAFRGGVGLFAQPPSAQQTSGAMNALFPGTTIGNPLLAPQRAMHYALGIEERLPVIGGMTWTSHLSISVEGFYKQLDALAISTPSYLQRSNPPSPPYVSAGTGQVVGMEVLLRYHPDPHFFGWVAYTLSRSTRTDGAGATEHLYLYDQTHILTVLGSYVIGAGFEVGLRFRYVTGSLTTPVVGSFYDTSSLRYTPVMGPANSARLPDFVQLDLRVDKTFRFRWGSVGLFLEILNVTNNANVEGYQYNFDYTQRANINGLPIIPNLGIRGEL